MSTKVKSIVGIAGAGKTTFLSKLLTGQETIDGLPKFSVMDTACISFSRMAKSALLNKLPAGWTVNTFHSFYSKKLHEKGLVKKFLDIRHINTFLKHHGLKQIFSLDEYAMYDGIYADFNKMRLMILTPEAYYYDDNIEKSSELRQLSFREFEHLYNKFTEFIEQFGSDYTDILVKAYKYKIKPDVKYFVIDEANDLSRLQWELALNSGAELILLVGDPNQNIYEFAGSNVNFILQSERIHELTKSNRVPHTVLEEAQVYMPYPFKAKLQGTQQEGYIYDIYENEIPNRVKRELQKSSNKNIYALSYRRKTAEKISKCLLSEDIPHLLFNNPVMPISIVRVALIKLAPEQLSIYDVIKIVEESKLPRKSSLLKILGNKNSKSKNIKAGNWYPSKHVLDNLKNAEAKFLLPDRNDAMELYQKLIEAPEWLNPKVNVSTIHQVKGGEADSVILYFDMANSQINNNQEYAQRLLYVALTRTKQDVFLVSEGTHYNVERAS